MAPRSLLLPLCFVMALAACTLFRSQDVASLKAWEGQAAQDEIRRQWGDPITIRSLAGGESLWIYEKREEQPGSRATAPGTWCDQYRLTFTDSGILRHWTHRSYFHGGELMPKECVPTR